MKPSRKKDGAGAMNKASSARAPFALVLVCLLASCSGRCDTGTPTTDPNFGARGQPCNRVQWPFTFVSCDDPSTSQCTHLPGDPEGGVCRGCGMNGELPCPGDICQPGLFMTRPRGAADFVCTSACGDAGEACCEGVIVQCPGLRASHCSPATGRCVSAPDDCVGPVPATVRTRQSNGCAGPDFTGLGDDAGEALVCARNLITGAGLGEVSASSLLEERTYCVRTFLGEDTVTVSGYSDDDREACARWRCGVSTCEGVSEGPC